MTDSHYLTHTTRDGERWDQIAWRYYGDVSMQDGLIVANRALFPAAFSVPLILSAGLTLRIPIIERQDVVAIDGLPAWKR